MGNVTKEETKETENILNGEICFAVLPQLMSDDNTVRNLCAQATPRLNQPEVPSGESFVHDSSN